MPSIPRMLDKLKSFFAKPEIQAAATLPEIVEPKVPNKPQTKQSFSRRTATSTGDQKLTSSDRRTANLDILSLRNGTSTKSTIHDLSQVSPDLSASVYAYQRLVVTKEFRAVARNLDGTINTEATKLVQSLIARMNYLTDYTDGFSGVTGIHALAEQLCLELRLYGALAMELVLDKARVPNRLQPISTTQIEFVEDKTGYAYPVQRLNGAEISLDFPTFFYESLDQDLLTAYSSSPMEAALQSTLADTEFTNDVRRTIKRALHPRLNVSIDSDKFRKSMPIDVMGDTDKMREFQENFIGDLDTTVNGLEVDDALVSFDSVEFAYLQNGNSSLSAEWDMLQKMINAKTATGTKSPSFVLGHGSGSQNVASSESLLFLKYCEGMQVKINSVLSRALTLAARLLGQDVYVKFAFDHIDLRPKAELTTFTVMEQSRVLELLSIGMISDEEASVMLTGNLPPAGAPKLSGTFFKAGATDPNAADVASAQSTTGAVNQTLTPDTPKAPKGPAQQDPKKGPTAEVEMLTARVDTLAKGQDEMSRKHQELGERHATLGKQHDALERQQYLAVNRRPEPDPVLRALAANLAQKPEAQPLNVHVHMPEGLVQMASATAPNIQIDVHVPEAAAAAPVPAPNIQIDVHVPEAAAPTVNVTNDVQPAPVTVNNAFASKATQTVERDAQDEIMQTVTTYEA